MQTLVKSNGLVRPCCMPENLVVVREDGEHNRSRGDLVVRVCRTCKSRHIELTVSPGRAFARGVEL